jgi:hypothetical protein
MSTRQTQVPAGVYVPHGIDVDEEPVRSKPMGGKRNSISRKSGFQLIKNVYSSTTGNVAREVYEILDLIEGYIPSDKTPQASANLIEENLERRIKPGQEWFWTEEWQAAEKEVEADLRAGRFETFSTMEDFLADLE